MPIHHYRSSIPRSRGILILGSSGTDSTVNSGTAETQLASISVPAGLMGTNGKLRIRTWWKTPDGTGNNKTMRVRFGGSGGTIYQSVVVTTTTGAYLECHVQSNNSASAQKNLSANSSGAVGTVAGSFITSTVDTTVATSVYISGITALSGEIITLAGYTVEFIPGV